MLFAGGQALIEVRLVTQFTAVHEDDAANLWEQRKTAITRKLYMA
jgi:hypothetical protein